MAINTFEFCDKNAPVRLTGTPNKAAILPPGRFVKIALEADDPFIKRGKRKKKHSPYLHSDKIQLLSRITEKKFVHRKNELFSSFPLATNIYRANSDEFKLVKKNKPNRRKAKKSVLTLPNVPAPIPQSCTVSDMNDSEYYKSRVSKMHKKPTTGPYGKLRMKSKGFEYYDRDAKHSHLACSSTDLLNKNYDGDGKKSSSSEKTKTPNSEDLTAQDVWTVLRNINKFQFRPSPRISEASVAPPKKKKTFIKRNGALRNGRRLIETRRTEEIAYVANFAIKSKTSVSQTSSFDRVTVINRNELKNQNFFEKDFGQNLNPPRPINKPKNLVPFNDKKINRFLPKNALKSLQYHNRVALLNKNQNDSYNNNPLNLQSTSTIKESIDSSNYFRNSDSECLSSSTMKSKTLKNPHQLRDIIFNGKCAANNLLYCTSSERMTKGMTHMLYNENNAQTTAKFGIQKPKPRLVTTMPSAAAMPRLTTADIKRRIAQIKFPIVILAKDQLSSNIEVLDYEPPQFEGLKEHIWPYMAEWSKNGAKLRNMQQKNNMLPLEHITNNLRKANNDLSARVREKKLSTAESTPRKKIDHKRNPPQEESSPRKQKVMRQFKDKMLRLIYKKPSINALEQATEPVQTVENVQTVVKTADVSTETEHTKPATTTIQVADTANLPKKPNELIARLGKRPNGFAQVMNNKLQGGRYPWARAKWASDFVDNVIRKIKTGTYYCNEIKCGVNEQRNNGVVSDKILSTLIDAGTFVDFNDVSVQTFNVPVFEDTTKTNDADQSFGHFIPNNLNVDNIIDKMGYIPGFDDILPELEIKTLNANQISVKHRLTNVMVQFDVAVPDKASVHLINDKNSNSSSCIPLSVTESHTKVFKCNTKILNAVLPAELCSVIPKVMRNIFDSDSSSSTIKSSLTDSRITISEISEVDYAASSISSSIHQNTNLAAVSNPWIYPHYGHWVSGSADQPVNPTKRLLNVKTKSWTQGSPWTNGLLVPPYGMPEYLPLYIPPIMRKYIYGCFAPFGTKRFRRRHIPRDTSLISRISLRWTESSIIPKVNVKSILPFIAAPILIQRSEINYTTEKPCDPVVNNQLTECLALQTYTGAQGVQLPYYNDFRSMLFKMWDYCKFNIKFNMPYILSPLQMTYDKNSITVDILVGNDRGIEKTMSVRVTNLKVDSLFNRLNRSSDRLMQCTNGGTKVLTVKSIGYSEHQSQVTKMGKKAIPVKKSPEKVRRRGFVKLYKKCKSTSNISGERLCTSLSKITNLEDFFQALGSAKVLSSVFDGAAERKVMGCVREMKNWIEDITPRQALLVLLLTNKKDTANLVRFRPVLLQGIAVNRITRATELDMEIEVIEKENVKITQYEGISGPIPVENQDDLLEELCWIAKTTASDYHKIFDESSERLLKSLLEKRKKLNPSYLRVMARYVGLGLLKTPVKHDRKH